MKTELGTRVSGSLIQTYVKAVEFRFGLTGRDTKAGGKITKPTAMGDLSMQMATFTMATGRTTRHMGSGSTLTLMVRAMRVAGRRTSRMVTD